MGWHRRFYFVNMGLEGVGGVAAAGERLNVSQTFQHHPGACAGTAARLPKNPGIQKLMPPSSARAIGTGSASSEATAPTHNCCRENPDFPDLLRSN